VTDAIGALGVLGENLQQEAIGNIKDDIAALENAYENKEQIANAILESLEQFPERLADMDPSAIRSLVAVLGEAAIPVGILVKANKVDVPDTPKVDMAIADNEVSHSTLDQDPVVQALREKDRQSIDPNSSDISVDNEMIGQDGPTYDGIIEPEKFDATALEGQKRQQQMLDDNTGYNVSSAADEISYPNSTIGGAGTYITDRQAFESSLGSLPENGGVVQVTREQIDTLEGSVGLRPGSLEDGSVIRQINNLDTTSPSSPVGPAGGPPGNEYFRGTGMHLPDGSPEIISEAQSRVNNPNIGSNWTIEVID
jgi:hypothetical protein